MEGPAASTLVQDGRVWRPASLRVARPAADNETMNLFTGEDQVYRRRLKRVGVTCVGFNMRKATRMVTKHYDTILPLMSSPRFGGKLLGSSVTVMTPKIVTC